MYKYFTATNSHEYIKALPKLMEGYNHTYHRSIKTTPASVNIDNAESVWRNLYTKPNPSISYQFNVDDTVGISMATRPFRKGCLPNWTTELFTISAQISHRQTVYKLKNYDDEELDGTLYEQAKWDNMYKATDLV